MRLEIGQARVSIENVFWNCDLGLKVGGRFTKE